MGVPGQKEGEGASLNGAWGWAIPKSSPAPDAGWEFLKWVESAEITKERALAGGAPTRSGLFDDPQVNAKYPYYPALENLLAASHNRSEEPTSELPSLLR